MTFPGVTSQIIEVAETLLRETGISPLQEIVSVAGGRNNRTYRLMTDQGTFLFKHYYHDPSGRWDRCSTEWNWSTFCWDQGIRSIPQPLASQPTSHASLFEFVDGRRLKREEISESHVQQAADFAAAVNRHRDHAQAVSLKNAAEACFSLQQHLDCVESRVQRLSQLSVHDEVDQELHDWLQQSLRPSWRSVQSHLVRSHGGGLDDGLPESYRCLSPSDFGFHNAIVTASGQLRFIDFEYAGWDDPAKLVCDFYLQPQLPAPALTRPILIDALAGKESQRELTQRIDALLPVYVIKWCCLMLNEFVAADRQRREFAKSAPVDHELRSNKLQGARLLLDSYASRVSGRPSTER